MKQKLSLFILYYLRFFARLQIQKYKKTNPDFKVVGITGSAGKSSAIMACEAALKPNFKVISNNGYNSESGIPMGILGLKISDYSISSWIKIIFQAPISYFKNKKIADVLLLEMGIDGPTWPKNMEFLLSIVKPDIGIFLNVTSVHLLNFQNIEEIAKEKSKLVNSSKIAIINQFDPLVKKYTTNKNIIAISKDKVDIPGYILPDVYQSTIGSAISLAHTLKLDKNTILKNLKNNFSLPPSRSSVFKGVNDSTIIDSSYNSSPLACIEMLNFLNTFKSPKIAILGDMRELGTSSKIEHQKIYNHALKCADTIISVGQETKKYFGSKANKFSNWWEALDFIKNNLPQKSTILIKGSQNTIFLEEIVKSLLQNKSDESKICRQSEYWLKTKSNYRSSN